MKFSQKMRLYVVYTMVQKNSKMTKISNQGGPALLSGHLDCSLPACQVRLKQTPAEMHVRTAIQSGRFSGTRLLPDLAASPLGQEFAGPHQAGCHISRPIYLLFRALPLDPETVWKKNLASDNF